MTEQLQQQTSVFWIEVEKIVPNPMQPRKEFNAEHLASLSDSIRQYGILQPLVVTRNETETMDGIVVEMKTNIIGKINSQIVSFIPTNKILIFLLLDSNKLFI